MRYLSASALRCPVRLAGRHAELTPNRPGGGLNVCNVSRSNYAVSFKACHFNQLTKLRKVAPFRAGHYDSNYVRFRNAVPLLLAEKRITDGFHVRESTHGVRPSRQVNKGQSSSFICTQRKIHAETTTHIDHQGGWSAQRLPQHRSQFDCKRKIQRIQGRPIGES